MLLMIQGGAFAVVAMGIAFVLLPGSNGVVLLSIGNRGSVHAAGPRRGDVAEVVLTRPHSMRLMTTTFRPMNEGSWG